MRFASRLASSPGRASGAWSLHLEAMRQRAAGRDIILLTVGDPDQPAPDSIIAATIAALQQRRTSYSPILGLADVRKAIATRVAQRTNQPCAVENVAIVPGAQAGLFCALHCLAGPGDEVVVPEPLYATYPAVIEASGARMINVPLLPAVNFHLDMDALRNAVTTRTRGIWINSPHNPTGAVLTHAEVATIAEICRQHDLWLLSDEVYEELAFARPHVSPWSLPGMAERTIVVSSLSKVNAIPGFRFGWIVGPPQLIEHLFGVIVSMFYGGPPFIQLGVLPALTEDLSESSALRRDYQRRATLVSGILGKAENCRVIPPEGGMFVVLDVGGSGLGSDQFARALLDQQAVAVLPCDGFGPSGRGLLRISLTRDDASLAEAAERIVTFAASVAAQRTRE